MALTEQDSAAGTPGDRWIPNINIGQEYDRSHVDAPVHYDALQNLASFFGRDMPVHRHAQYLQVHFIDRGNINFHIDDKLYQVSGPACFLTPPAVPHSFQTDAAAQGHVLTIHQSLIWRLLRRGLQQEPQLTLERGACLTPTAFDDDQALLWRRITELLDALATEWRHNAPAKSLMLENLVELLLIQIARLSPLTAASTPVNNDDLRLFRRFSDLVEQHYRKHWRLAEYAQHIGVSESRLNQLCQHISNTSPKKLIHDRLVQESKRLLIFTSLSSSEISYQLGFRDPAYFARFFKTHAGNTAQQYRRAQK